MNPEFQPHITPMNTDEPAAEKHLRPSVPSAAKKEIKSASFAGDSAHGISGVPAELAGKERFEMNPEFQPQMSPMNTDEPAAEKHLCPFVSSAAEKEPAPKISVIVPVYKVEKYLPECIESVLAQTFTDFELILVDDGSPDNSGAICDAYAARDPRIRVFHKENGGVTSARRLGVERSRAEWIMFVDSDDVVSTDALALLFAHADADTDIVEGEYELFSGDVPVNRTGKIYSGVSMSSNVTDYAAGIGNGIWLAGPFAKIFCKRLLTPWVMSVPARFNVGEDVLMNLRAAVSGLRKAVKLRQSVYFYRFRDGSAMRTFSASEAYYYELYEAEKETLQRIEASEEAFARMCAWRALHVAKVLVLESVPLRGRGFWQKELKPLSGSLLPCRCSLLLPWAIAFVLRIHCEKVLALTHSVLTKLKKIHC